MTVWTEESLRFEDEYRRAHLRQVAGHHALGTNGPSTAGRRESTRSATWWRWLHVSLRH